MDRKKTNIVSSLTFDENTMPIIQQIAEGMPGGFFIYYADGNQNLIYINSAMLRIFGCDTEEEFRELTGYTFRGLVHPEDRERVEESISTQIANSVYNMDYVEYRIIQKDGTVRWLEDYGHFIHTKLYGDIFCVFIQDATERLKNRMTELEKINDELLDANARESQYKNALLHQAVWFFECNLTRDSFITTKKQMMDGQKRDWFPIMDDHSFEKYSEYIELWLNHIEIPNREEYKSFFNLKRLLQCYEDEEPKQTFDGWITDSLGKQHLCHYLILLAKNSNTDDIVALFMAKDITRQAEKHKLLRSALRQAESANLARNTFLTSMSHDIRTPLNAIIGYTELVKNHITDPDKINDYITKIRTSGEQLLAIVDESLEITRLESTKANLRESDCHIEDILESAAKTVSRAAASKSIHFSVSSSGVRHFAVIADSIRIKEILCKLLDNAIKYTDSNGNISLSVTETEFDYSGYGKYQFAVEDTGSGISKEFLNVLFDPFKRENNTTQSGVLGTGLGLTVVKNLVDMMEGEIEVESEPDKGSTFTVTLLLRLQKDQTSHKKLPCETLIDKACLVGKRILVVEDNEINSEIAKELLQTLGYVIETAPNGSVALEMVKNSKPGYYALILMDIQMPIMDGYTATKAIRKLKDKALAHIPIIALSANAYVEDYHRSLEAGMDAHFPKPIDIHNLQESIRTVLSARL